MIHMQAKGAHELLGVREDHDFHFQIPDEGLEGFNYFGLSVYGATSRAHLITHLINLYGEFVGRFHFEDWMRLNRAITKRVDEGFLSINALLPSVGFEREHSIVSTAVIDFYMYGETNADELTGVGGALSYEQELALVRVQTADVTRYEDKLETFKKGLQRNYTLATNHFSKSIDEIDKSISHRTKTREGLPKSMNHAQFIER